MKCSVVVAALSLVLSAVVCDQTALDLLSDKGKDMLSEKAKGKLAAISMDQVKELKDIVSKISKASDPSQIDDALETIDPKTKESVIQTLFAAKKGAAGQLSKLSTGSKKFLQESGLEIANAMKNIAVNFKDLDDKTKKNLYGAFPPLKKLVQTPIMKQMMQ